jgi:hypothetical protein
VARVSDLHVRPQMGCLKPAPPFSVGCGGGCGSCFDSLNLGLFDPDRCYSSSKPRRCCCLVDVLHLRCGSWCSGLFGSKGLLYSCVSQGLLVRVSVCVGGSSLAILQKMSLNLFRLISAYAGSFFCISFFCNLVSVPVLGSLGCVLVCIGC